MVKFGERLQQYSRKCWTYINYAKLVEIIDNRASGKTWSQRFLHALDIEIETVNQFWGSTHRKVIDAGQKTLYSKTYSVSSLNSLEREVRALRQWVILNYLAVLKIVKKHDKHVCGENQISKQIKERLFKQPFYQTIRNDLFVRMSKLIRQCREYSERCPICLSDMAEWSSSASTAELPCGHRFCVTCLFDAHANDISLCPLCRREQSLNPSCVEISMLLGAPPDNPDERKHYYPSSVDPAILSTYSPKRLTPGKKKGVKRIKLPKNAMSVDTFRMMQEKEYSSPQKASTPTSSITPSYFSFSPGLRSIQEDCTWNADDSFSTEEIKDLKSVLDVPFANNTIMDEIGNFDLLEPSITGCSHRSLFDSNINLKCPSPEVSDKNHFQVIRQVGIPKAPLVPRKREKSKNKNNMPVRPFGSIRCGGCNKFGVSGECCSKYYHVVVRSSRMPKEERSRLLKVQFKSFEEADEYRHDLAIRYPRKVPKRKSFLPNPKGPLVPKKSGRNHLPIPLPLPYTSRINCRGGENVDSCNHTKKQRYSNAIPPRQNIHQKIMPDISFTREQNQMLAIQRMESTILSLQNRLERTESRLMESEARAQKAERRYLAIEKTLGHILGGHEKH
eukprot:GSMAST32.ASY1.ANO1.148.1 assembled CDS